MMAYLHSGWDYASKLLIGERMGAVVFVSPPEHSVTKSISGTFPVPAPVISYDMLLVTTAFAAITRAFRCVAEWRAACFASQNFHGTCRHASIVTSLLVVMLAGCATNPGSCALIPLKEYPPAFRMAFSDQTAGIPDASPVGVFITDAVSLRDAVRACRGTK